MMPDYHALIVGAGFSGIGAAIKLDRAGFSDYLVVEAGDGVGGTWHWNTYPGIAVDIPSFSYQFSFEQSRHWSRTYRTRAEGLRRTLRRQIRHPVADPVEHQGACRRVR
ncbi:monoxygenase [Mycobacterium tuberculosis]|nr:monoxygenase [Mycobacterium tuberculosis]CNF71246.1 monoxygenase [Mycobacterium tuberculosis]